MDSKVNNWKSAAQARKNAEKWESMSLDKTRNGNPFKVSIPHCTPPVLVRAGAYHEGDQNYWNTEGNFNKAILQYLVENWDTVYKGALYIMLEKERLAIIECQSHVHEMQSMIDKATANI